MLNSLVLAIRFLILVFSGHKQVALENIALRHQLVSWPSSRMRKSDPDCVIDISEHMARKLEAIRCYKSQLEYWSYDRAIEGLNAYRGAMLGGFTFAEVFTARR